MKREPIPWVHHPPNLKWLIHAFLTGLLMAAMLSVESCKPKEDARVTIVYGKVTNQAGQPIDSVNITFIGHKGVSGGRPIAETFTNTTGSYELLVDVPKDYSGSSIVLSLNLESLRSKYQGKRVFREKVEVGSCCYTVTGTKTNYDFVLLPK